MVHQSSWTAESLIEFEGAQNIATTSPSVFAFRVFRPCFQQNINIFHDRSLSRSLRHGNQAYEQRRCGFEVTSPSATVIQSLRLQFLLVESFEPDIETQRTTATATTMAIPRPECRPRWGLTPIVRRIRRRWLEDQVRRRRISRAHIKFAISFN